jgi:steroid delta-isomerase-like uncharacterized protein
MTSSSTVLDSNKRLVYRFIDECWNGGDLSSVPELVAGHCHYHDPVFPHMIAGVESMQHHIRRCRRAFPDLKFMIADTIAEGCEVVLHWTVSGTQRGEFLGMPPTNRNALVAGTSIFRIEDGKIVEQWANWNLMSLMEQLGVGTAPGQQVEERAHVGWE